ncbi:hypothetical protein LO762_28355 [Actinocorallia sp. API 0066]|uniref:YncE family protein n=1 Tax=Actinocorallia sp. API 0066 TaxID=2896846 RepID=UPI001E5CC3D0|nr:hypothetical protein [Actinocorallia sp. API 0066]MCD0453065.1 hypothetical protein [Actinocorallia sp. API 0066]
MRFHTRVAAAVALTAAVLSGCGLPFAPGGRPGGGVVGLGAPAPYVPASASRLAGSPTPSSSAPGRMDALPGVGLPARAYLPHGRTVTVLDQRDLSPVRKLRLPEPVTRIVPSRDLRTLWAVGRTALVPLDPATLRAGTARPVARARDLVFTGDGGTALVLTDRRLEFRDPAAMRLRSALRLPCAPTAAAALTSDGERLVTACGRALLYIDWRSGMAGSADLPDAPTRLLLAPDGRTFFAATPSGVLLLDSLTLKETSRVALPGAVTTLIPAPSGGTVYASGPGTAAELGATGALLRPLPVPHTATLTALSPDGGTLWLREPGRLVARSADGTRHRSAPVTSTDATLHPHPTNPTPTAH